MEAGSLFFILGLLILTVLFISQPFIKRAHSQKIIDETQVSTLMAEKEQVIDALLELDFDKKLGKIPAEEYPVLRNFLLSKGGRIMQQLDALQLKNTAHDEPIKKDTHRNTREEKSSVSKSSNVTSRRGRTVKRPLTTPDDDLEILLATRRRERSEKAGGFCPQCGSPVQQSDRFCPRCGEALSPTGNDQ